MEISKILKLKDVESHHFISFCLPPNIQLEDKSGLNEWLERMMFLFEDLKWLLSLSPEYFWKQVLHDRSLSICIDTFLQNAPRRYDLRNLPDGCKIAMSRVSRLFLLVLKRMTSFNEKETLFENAKIYGDVIYENYVFDAAKVFDMCAVFYRDESTIQQIVQDIIKTIFESQPLYMEDLSNALDTFLSTIDDMLNKLLVKDGKNRVREFEAQDMLAFLYDSMHTFFYLIQLYPNVASVFFKVKFVSRLTLLHEKVLPDLLLLYQVNRKKFVYMSKQIEKLFIQLVDTVVQSAFIQNAVNKNDELVQSLTPDYVSIIDEISQHPSFLALYCTHGHLSDDIQILSSSNCIDTPSLEYINSMVAGVVKQNIGFSTLKILKDLLPGKSEYFLNDYIEKYGDNIEFIMDKIMEDTTVQTKPKDKPQKSHPNNEIIDDNKEHVALLKASLLGAEENYNPAYDMYEDEYDDTYDSHNVGAMDADSADELDQIVSRRSFTIPNVLRQLGDTTPSNSDDSENEQNEVTENSDPAKFKKSSTTTSFGKDHNNRRGGEKGFRGRGTSNRGRDNNNKRNDGNSNRGRGDGRGRPRGRGRGRGGNHNRRVLADKKRSGGMIPH